LAPESAAGLSRAVCVCGRPRISLDQGTWILAVVSVALIRAALRTDTGDTRHIPSLTPKNKLALGICMAAVLAVAWRRYDVTTAGSKWGLRELSEAAVRYVEKLTARTAYNDFTSGGFDMRLPSIPVSIDGAH